MLMGNGAWALALLAFSFAGLFGLNLYFRVKVMRSYVILSRNQVQFAIRDIFSSARMNQVIGRYPQYRKELETFSRNLRFSVWMTSVFLVVVIIFGSVLMYYR